MANPSKAKGSRFEVAVRDWLAHRGVRVVRNPPAGTKDVGDLTVWDADGDAWCLELKATKSLDLASGMRELKAEKLNAGTEFGVCVFKKRNAPIADAYVVMSLDDFASIVAGEPF